MLEVSAELADVVTAGGFQHYYVADVVVDGDTVLEELPLASCQLDWNVARQVFAQGSCVVDYADEVGRTVVPETIADWFTPYATTLVVSMVIVTGGGFSEKVLRGVMRVTGVADPRERWLFTNGAMVSIGSSIRLTLADAFSTTAAEPFPVPTAPESTESTWAEIQRITGLGVQRNVDDVAIARDLAYGESRIDAVFALGRALGGRPVVAVDGKVTLLTDEWPAEGPRLTLGADSTVTPAEPADWTADGIYNEILVLAHDDSQGKVLGRARITEGPLRYGGPFGRRTKTIRDDQVTTVEQAEALAAAQLPKFSTRPARQFAIQTVPDPRREVGDVVSFTRENGTTYVGRITELKLAAPGPMTVVVEVPSG